MYQLNYFADTGVRISNTEGYLTIKSACNGKNELTVDSASYLGGAVEILGNSAGTNVAFLNRTME